jgi:alpha-D-ribose 1-methylphosphonate 5-triphosphate synthase subunit PhnH
MIPATRIPAPGFAEPVRGAQQTFRGILDALARPTTAVALPAEVHAPGGLSRGAAALLLTLVDGSTPLWLDPQLAADADLTAWIAFHCGAPLVEDRDRAAFAVVAAAARLPELSTFALGSDEAPHTSTTVIVATTRQDGGPTFTAYGPGFPEPAAWHAPALPTDFAAQWSRNGALFPRGVDLVFAGDDTLVGLPRTTRLTEVD